MHATSVGVSAGLHIIFFTANIIQLQTEIGLWYVGVAPPPLLFFWGGGCGGCKQGPPHNLFSQKTSFNYRQELGYGGVAPLLFGRLKHWSENIDINIEIEVEDFQDWQISLFCFLSYYYFWFVV